MAAKRRKKQKNKISGRVNSVCYTDYVLSRAEDAAKKGVEVEIIRYAA
jgi:hypothetical protein